MLNILRPGDRLVLRVRLARAALLWERIWPALWPALCVLGVFAAVALFDLLPGLPGLAHAALLALFAVAFVAAAAWGVRAARRGGWPDTSAARRRIEQASGLPHRPLQALGDRPSAPLDGDARLLWAAHQRRMAAALRRLRVGWPVAGLARRDPWGHGCCGRRISGEWRQRCAGCASDGRLPAWRGAIRGASARSTGCRRPAARSTTTGRRCTFPEGKGAGLRFPADRVEPLVVLVTSR